VAAAGRIGTGCAAFDVARKDCRLAQVKFSERALRVILWLLALDALIGGLVLLVGGRTSFSWLFPHLSATEVTDLLLFKQRTWGGLGAAFTILLVAAAKDPRGKSIVVWAMAAGLAVAGVAELSSLWLLDIGRLFPVATVLAHSLARVGIALALVILEKRLLANARCATAVIGQHPR
jgi:hypothetical protein